MTLILCADDRNGMLFHNRRLSRDSSLCAQILVFCDGKELWMNNYSASIFPRNVPNIRISENFLEQVGSGGFCFAENVDISKVIPQANRIVIYRWNRSYPSDVKLPDGLLTDRKLVSTFDFVGNSHSCITQEVYEL